MTAQLPQKRLSRRLIILTAVLSCLFIFTALSQASAQSSLERIDLDNTNGITGGSIGFNSPNNPIFGQTFVPTVDNLSGIELVIGSGGTLEGVEVLMTIHENDASGSLIGSGTWVIGNGALNGVIFDPPIPLTPGETYAFQYDVIDGGPFNVTTFLAQAPSASVSGSAFTCIDDCALGVTFLSGSFADLAFKTYYLASDGDSDGVADDSDNCPTVANADQANFDGDAEGDACDADDDNDGVDDVNDAFPFDASESADSDADGIGDNADNCAVSNADQADSNSDGQGDACDPLVTDLTSALEPVAIDDQPVSATATFSDADDGDAHTAVFDWGDGNTTTGTVDQAANSATATPHLR